MAFYQVRPKEEGAGELFGKGLGAGFGESLQGQLGQFFEQRESERQQVKLKKKLEELGPDASFSEKMQALALSPHGSPEARKAVGESLKMQEGMKFAKKFAEGKHTLEDVISGDVAGILHPSIGAELVRQIGKKGDIERSGQIAELYDAPSNAVKGMDASQANKFLGDLKEKGSKIFDEVTAETLTAKKTLEDLSQLDKLLNKGAFDPATAANYADTLQEGGHTVASRVARAFASPESAEAQTLIKDLYTDLIKGIPAKGINIMVERIMREMLPLMGRSKEANLAVGNILKKTARMKLIPSDVRNEILAEHGGKVPWNFANLYQQRLGSKADEEVERVNQLMEQAEKQFIGKETQSSSDNIQKFSSLPDPASFKGQTIVNKKTGEEMHSDGKAWKKVAK